MIRKIILFVLGLILIGGAIYVAKGMMASRKIPAPKERKIVTSVFTQTVKNQNTAITISSNGLLTAKKRFEIFSEVQGIFQYSSKSFKPGLWYDKSSVLIRMNSDELQANLRSLRSGLLNQIVLLLPDLKLDYPTSFAQWENYIKNFDVDKTIAELPQPKTEREKLFISGRNIFSPYYNVKNLEERLSKYTIYAPFGGILTDALVTPGTLIRPGQKLGEFISPSIYEMQAPINVSYIDKIKVGQQVELQDIEKTQRWKGKVIRINNLVDPQTQSVYIYIQVTGKGLREGMYLEADLVASEVPSTMEIDRKLINENRVYLVKDTLLQATEVEPVHYNDKTVIVRGLEEGAKILAKPVPGAYDGMQVKIIQPSTDPL